MNLKTYDSATAAKYMMALANTRGRILNVTKVQKLLYVVYGIFLARYDHVIINEEPRAWPYGPVFPRTRTEVDYGVIMAPDDVGFIEVAADPVATEVFNYIVDKYAAFSSTQLSNWSHSTGGPWARTVQQTGFKWNEPIPDEFIKPYFKYLDV